MRFENTGIENLTIELSKLTHIMKEEGLVFAGQWDYDRVTYDRKFVIKDETFYLRVQGYAIEGEVEENGKYAVIKLITPILGKHYYPHGVEYGEDENFPKSLIEQCNRILAKVKENISAFSA
ncbi:YugN family protein [Ferdinandcohnia quinoae]|uniref:YugN-like family protein n=1 Tax=Fredinandcohnia quinoae TaxID=2918902 RepID=A0AAW5DTC8_9BACI|nr:YugN family protein [Fredinandcohnia sp. SECRCQ15]MCH1623912.1 YugN-like family protein [Fredinandcohnia sp. SECRCQ15]